MTTDLLALPSDSTTHPWLRDLSLVTSPDAKPRNPRSDAKTGAASAEVKPFDAADEYLLHEFARRNFAPGSNVLVVNDRYGALTTALAGRFRVTTWSDSFLALEVTETNLTANGLDPSTVTFLASTDSLADSLADSTSDSMTETLTGQMSGEHESEQHGRRPD